MEEKEEELKEANEEFHEIRVKFEAIIREKDNYASAKSEQLLSLQNKSVEEMVLEKNIIAINALLKENDLLT